MAVPDSLNIINLPKTASDSQVKAAQATVAGNLGPFSCAGAPVDGVDAVQLLTISGSPSSGGIIITSGGGFSTPSLTFAQLVTASAGDAQATVKAALEALSDIGVGNIASVVRSGSTPNYVFTVTWGGTQAGKPQTLLSVADTFDQGDCTPTSSATGVAGTERGNAALGAYLARADTGAPYVNKGSMYKPAWKAFTTA